MWSREFQRQCNHKCNVHQRQCCPKGVVSQLVVTVASKLVVTAASQLVFTMTSQLIVTSAHPRRQRCVLIFAGKGNACNLATPLQQQQYVQSSTPLWRATFLVVSTLLCNV
ncbi:hypothetical protein DVH24_027424 [Malus domestica]|uniref:Uncharacterized protein n=1 Tax=Malus domestica TaxID=3750 RepID=A0A498HAK8_MALDO|nr:hypothetical protein DVH24_027424 [Malus domestica]